MNTFQTEHSPLPTTTTTLVTTRHHYPPPLPPTRRIQVVANELRSHGPIACETVTNQISMKLTGILSTSLHIIGCNSTRFVLPHVLFQTLLPHETFLTVVAKEVFWFLWFLWFISLRFRTLQCRDINVQRSRSLMSEEIFTKIDP